MATAFHNISTSQLADDFGALKLQSDALAKRLDEIKAELKTRTAGDGTIETERFTVSVSTSERVTYDDKAIREALGAEICEQYKRTSETVTVRVKQTVVFEQAA
jgi:hypothetical protein